MLNISRSEVFSTPSTTMCMTQRSDLENTELIYNEKEFFVYINVRGVATFDSICRVFDQVVSSNRYKPHMGRIWDFSLSDLSSLDGNAISRLELTTRR